MIDFSNLNKQKLSRIGIAFATPEETESFSKFVLEQLEIKIGESISSKLSEQLLQEFDLITDASESASWLEKHCPNYRWIVDREQHHMIWLILCLRNRISTVVSPPQPYGIDDELSKIGLSLYTNNYIKSQNIKTIRDILSFRSFDGLPGLYKYHQEEIITKVVDYIISDKNDKGSKQKSYKHLRLHPMSDYFVD